MPRVVGMARTVSAPMRTAALQEPMCCPVSSETKACSTPPRPTSTASDSLPDTPRCPSVPSSNGTIPSYDAHDFRNKRQRHVVEDVRRSPHPPPASPRQSPLRFIAVAEHHPGTTIASPRIASPLTEQLDGRARPLGDVHLEQMLEDQEENGVVTHSAGYKLHLADNQTGYKGVSRSTRGRPTFCAQKYFKGKNITIGTFATKVEAAVAFAKFSHAVNQTGKLPAELLPTSSRSAGQDLFRGAPGVQEELARLGPTLGGDCWLRSDKHEARFDVASLEH